MSNIYRPFPGDITQVHGIRVGQMQHDKAQTGVTVVLAVCCLMAFSCRNSC